MEVAKRLVMMAATGPVLMAATGLVSMVTVAEWPETGGSECLPCRGHVACANGIRQRRLRLSRRKRAMRTLQAGAAPMTI